MHKEYALKCLGRIGPEDLVHVDLPETSLILSVWRSWALLILPFRFLVSCVLAYCLLINKVAL